MPFSRSFVLAAGLILALSLVPLAVSQQPSSKLPEATDNEQIIAYWTTETGWKSELQLRNNMADRDLVVTPALRLAGDGAETALAPVSIKPQEVKSIDLDAAIGASSPQLIGTYGSLVLRYHSTGYRNLYAALMVRNIGHPFAFHIDATGESQEYQSGGREGVWWFHRPNMKILLGLFLAVGIILLFLAGLLAATKGTLDLHVHDRYLLVLPIHLVLGVGCPLCRNACRLEG
jgi:hypothetical protein